jgi:hypothetical protein
MEKRISEVSNRGNSDSPPYLPPRLFQLLPPPQTGPLRPLLHLFSFFFFFFPTVSVPPKTRQEPDRRSLPRTLYSSASFKFP